MKKLINLRNKKERCYWLVKFVLTFYFDCCSFYAIVFGLRLEKLSFLTVFSIIIKSNFEELLCSLLKLKKTDSEFSLALEKMFVAIPNFGNAGQFAPFLLESFSICSTAL